MRWLTSWRNHNQKEKQIMGETVEVRPVLQLNRVIAASRERVFAAWTTPEEIKVWFGPETCQVLDAEVDLRVGGEYCFHLSTQQFGEIRVRGQYREVTAPAKLVYTWHWDSELESESSLVSVEFAVVGSSTEIRLKHEQLPNAQSRDDHSHGWSGTLDKLEKYLAN
jgi:uncharacterized protein YndB with AHSA1/START domain